MLVKVAAAGRVAAAPSISSESRSENSHVSGSGPAPTFGSVAMATAASTAARAELPKTANLGMVCIAVGNATFLSSSDNATSGSGASAKNYYQQTSATVCTFLPLYDDSNQSSTDIQRSTSRKAEQHNNFSKCLDDKLILIRILFYGD